MKKLVVALLLPALILVPAPISVAQNNTISAEWMDTLNRIRPSVALLQNVHHGFDGEFHENRCTAFSINQKERFYATVAHCVDDSFDLKVGGKEAVILVIDKKYDLAVVRVYGGDAPAIPLADTIEESTWKPDQTLDWCSEMGGGGFANGNTIPTAMMGCTVYANIYADKWERSFGWFSTNFVEGMSGGPVVNKEGKLISIIQVTNPPFGGGGATLGDLKEKLGKYWE